MLKWIKRKLWPSKNLMWTYGPTPHQTQDSYIYHSEALIIPLEIGMGAMEPLGLRFNQLSESIRKNKILRSVTHVVLYALPVTAVISWIIGNSEENTTLTTIGTLFAVSTLGSIPVYQTLKKSNPEIDLEMIRLLLPNDSEVSEMVLQRLIWFSQNNIPLYRLDANGKFERLSSFNWYLKNAMVFVLGTDQHRNVLDLRGPTPKGNLYFHKDDYSRLLEFEKELLLEETSEDTKKPPAASVLTTEEPTQGDTKVRQIQADLRPTLKSLKFPHSRSLIYDRARCISFANYVRNARKSDPRAPHLKPSKKRDQWLEGIEVNIANWNDWDAFRKLTKNKRYAAENLSKFDKKLRTALGLPLGPVIKDTPIYDKFINGSTVAFEKWLDDILRHNPDAF